MKFRTFAVLLLSTQAVAADLIVVDQKDRAFGARAVEIKQGETIRFNNKDDFGHQVFAQSPSFAFDTDEVDPGSYVDIRFPIKGHFTVRCHIHPRMRLDVDVN